MLFSKFKTALMTSVLTWLFSIGLTIVGGILYKLCGGDGKISVAIGASFLMIIYLIPVILIVGIPISVASDELTCESNHRKLFSYFVHIGIGLMLFFFVFPSSYLSPWLLIIIFSASLFWKFDEKAKMKLEKYSLDC